jgi:hypothetical protein
MKSSVFWALVRKDMYVLRGFMIATLVAGLLGLVVMRFGKAGYAVGGILFLTANVASGIFIAMYSLLTERKERSRMFALSLPISGYRHELSKLLSGYLGFGLPWLVLTLVAAGGLLPDAAERGMIVYVLMLQCFVLALFSVVLAALFVITSEAMSGVVILSVNICFSLFMVTLSQPQVTAPLRTAQIVWTPFALWTLSAEFAVIALALAFATFVMSRRRDFI